MRAADTTPPAAPSRPSLVTNNESDTGWSNTDNYTSDITPTFTGTAEPLSYIEVFRAENILIGDAGTRLDGVWIVQVGNLVALPEGVHQIVARATDPSGNVGPFSPPLTVTVDRTAPAAPRVDRISDDNGSYSFDALTSDTTLVIHGSAEPESRVEVFKGGVSIGQTTTGSDGLWSFDYTGTTLAAGEHAFTAQAQDRAGNNSPLSDALIVTIDTDIPAPTITRINNDTGVSATDGLTNDNTLDIRGTAEPLSIVELTRSGAGVIGTTFTSQTGEWSFDYTGTTLADGGYLFTARATNVAGAVSAVSADFPVTIDTTAPTITAAPPVSVSYKSAFTHTIAASGSPVSFGATGLPPGVTLNPATGEITGAPAQAGTFAIALSATDAAGNTGTSTLTLTVQKVALTITGLVAGTKAYDGTTYASVNASGASLVGVIAGDDVVLASGLGGTFATPNVGTAIPVTVSGLALGGFSAVNYTVSAPALSADIVPRPVVVTANPATKPYGTPDPAFTYAVLPGGLVGADTLSGTLARVPGENVGNYAILPGTLSAGTNYAIRFNGSQLTITKAEATIEFVGLNATYDGTPRAVSIVTNPSGLGASITYDGLSQPPTNVGSYTVRATIGATNYFGSAQATLVIGKAPQTITFPPIADVPLFSPPITVNATASSGLPVSLAVVAGPAFAYANTIWVNGAGSVTIRATQPGNDNYLAATPVERSFVVGKATAPIVLGNLAQTYDGSPRIVAATTTPANLPVVIRYDGSLTPPTNAGSYSVTASIEHLNYTGSASGTLVVSPAPATITFTDLVQRYDGRPKPVTATTSPAGLAVSLTYDGGPTPPTEPGRYIVSAVVNDPNYRGTATDTLAIIITSIVRHAPELNGDFDGSLQMLLPESIAINGNTMISGEFLVPGTPTLRINGNPMLGALVDSNGNPQPSNYQIALQGNSLLGKLVRRVDPLAIPAVAAPPPPAGTRTVTLARSTDPIGDWSTLRHLTLSGNVGTIPVPPGTYGNFAAGSGGGFTLGVAGSTTPAVYHLQNLTLTGNAGLRIVGPVSLTLANGVTFNANVGDAAHPQWLTLRVAAGDVKLNTKVVFAGEVIAPNSALKLSAGSTLKGRVTVDRLTISGNALLSDPESL